jgi:hypothetical protein
VKMIALGFGEGREGTLLVRGSSERRGEALLFGGSGHPVAQPIRSARGCLHRVSYGPSVAIAWVALEIPSGQVSTNTVLRVADACASAGAELLLPKPPGAVRVHATRLTRRLRRAFQCGLGSPPRTPRTGPSPPRRSS